MRTHIKRQKSRMFQDGNAALVEAKGGAWDGTVVLRNIACSYTPAGVKDVLDSVGLRGTFSLVRVPRRGTAVVLFDAPEAAAACLGIFSGCVFSGQWEEGAKGRKVCEVRFPEMGDEPMCGSQDEEAFCGMQSAPQSNDEAVRGPVPALPWCARAPGGPVAAGATESRARRHPGGHRGRRAAPGSTVLQLRRSGDALLAELRAGRGPPPAAPWVDTEPEMVNDAHGEPAPRPRSPVRDIHATPVADLERYSIELGRWAALFGPNGGVPPHVKDICAPSRLAQYCGHDGRASAEALRRPEFHGGAQGCLPRGAAGLRVTQTPSWLGDLTAARGLAVTPACSPEGYACAAFGRADLRPIAA